MRMADCTSWPLARQPGGFYENTFDFVQERIEIHRHDLGGANRCHIMGVFKPAATEVPTGLSRCAHIAIQFT